MLTTGPYALLQRCWGSQFGEGWIWFENTSVMNVPGYEQCIIGRSSLCRPSVLESLTVHAEVRGRFSRFNLAKPRLSFVGRR